MKTAREFFETHQDLHERFRAEKIGVRAFEKAIERNFADARDAGDEVYREMGALIVADIKAAIRRTREEFARGRTIGGVKITIAPDYWQRPI